MNLSIKNKFTLNSEEYTIAYNMFGDDKLQNSYVSALVAGLILGLAGFMYLSVFNLILTYPIFSPFLKIISAFIFSYGLIQIIHQKKYLYTGCIGKANIYNSIEWLHLIFILFGNMCMLTLLACFTPILCPDLINVANSIVITKLSYSWIELLFKSIGCGIFMYLAVLSSNDFMIAFSVTGFILCGFEHCLADWFYLCVATNITIPAIIGFFIISCIGNTIGANIIRFIEGKFNFKFIIGFIVDKIDDFKDKNQGKKIITVNNKTNK